MDKHGKHFLRRYGWIHIKLFTIIPATSIPYFQDLHDFAVESAQVAVCAQLLQLASEGPGGWNPAGSWVGRLGDLAVLTLTGWWFGTCFLCFFISSE